MQTLIPAHIWLTGNIPDPTGPLALFESVTAEPGKVEHEREIGHLDEGRAYRPLHKYHA